MHCSNQLGSLSEYVDGDLDPMLCNELERHMAECRNCRVMVDTLRKTIILYRVAGHRPVPDEVRARLYAVLSLERTQHGISKGQ